MKKTMKLASRGKRFAAGMIDLAFPLIAYMIMVSVFGVSSMMYGRNGFGYGYGYGYNYNYNYGSDLSRGAIAAMAFLSVLLIAYVIVQLVFFSKAQSIGKAILGLQVVSSNDGRPFGFWMMVLREFIVKGASGNVFLLGYIWILIDDKNRGWHDKILDSFVVDLKETARMYARTARPADEVTVTQALPPKMPEPEEEKPEEVKPAEAEPVVRDEAPAEAEPAVRDKAPAETRQPKATMDMSVDELMSVAEEMGLEISQEASKPEIVHEINKAAGGKAE